MTTRQQVFDKAALGILEQGKRCENSLGCVYRNDDGLKCAIGHAMPDEKYSEELEGSPGSSPEIMNPIGLKFTDSNQVFIQDLQDIHDSFFVGEWPGLLIEFAEDWTLNAKVVRDWQEAQKS